MIDLDRQLIAYGDFLDNLERQIVVLRPQRTGPRRRSFHRAVAVAAACALVLVGTVGTAMTRLGWTNTSARSALHTEQSGWRLVSTAGAFEPILVPATRASTTITAVIDSSHGLVAVGYETNEQQSNELEDYFVPAVWQSDDGEDWQRLGHAGAFGDFSDNGRMLDVAEHGSRVVAVGVAGQHDLRAWRTDDLANWSSASLDRPSGYDEDWYGSVVAVAAGAQGFVTGGSIFTNHKDDGSGESSATFWYSQDGVEWSAVYIETAGGPESSVADVIAVDDGFIAVGAANAAPATWASSDGQTWNRVDVNAGVGDLRLSGPTNIVRKDDELIAFSSASNAESSGAIPAVIASSDDGATWQSQVLGRGNQQQEQTIIGLVTREGTLTVFAIGRRDDSYKVIEYTSVNGTAWATGVIDLPGIPGTATSFDEGTVVIAGPAWFYDLEPWSASANPTVWIKN